MKSEPCSASFSTGTFYHRLRSRQNVLKQAYGLRQSTVGTVFTLQQVPECYEHEIKRPDIPIGGDVVPCDWMRTNNANKFNGFCTKLAQCKVPRCENCVQIEIYGPHSVWQKTAPPGMTAEDHRFASRIRYLCNRCTFPNRPPGVASTETCICAMRDQEGIPTDMWFQCMSCAESCWMDHDGRFGNPGGKKASLRRPKTKKKDGTWVRPKARERRLLLRCICGRLAPTKHKRGSWCTWCHCPCD